MEEEFKDIVGYENLYQISNFGRVLSLNYKGSGKPGMMKPGKDKDGYYQVSLRKNGRSLSFKVHRLVAQTFLPNTDNKPEVDHIDGNPGNNCVYNLRWATSKENANNPITAYNVRVKNGQLRNKEIDQFDIDGTFIKRWDSIISIERELGYGHSFISHVCKGSNKGYGYIWKYAS